MTFKDLEDWQKELVVKNLKDGENIYIEYTKDDIIDGLKKENQELKNQQKEYIEQLEKLAYQNMVPSDFANGCKVAYGIALNRYKEIIGGDNK